MPLHRKTRKSTKRMNFSFKCKIKKMHTFYGLQLRPGRDITTWGGANEVLLKRVAVQAAKRWKINNPIFIY
jgi:hypothetical protein